MNKELQDIVNAVLYEGYILYPYRASSQKNQRERFTFGRVYPESYSHKEEGREPCEILTEVLLETREKAPDVHITLGFLQPIQREIGALRRPVPELPADASIEIGVVPRLKLNGKLYQTWMEAADRQVTVPLPSLTGSFETKFDFDRQCQVDPIINEAGLIAAVVRRTQCPIAGQLTVTSSQLKDGLYKISVTVRNHSPIESADLELPDKVLMSTLASTHVIFQAKSNGFVSLLEPPDDLAELARQCQNKGVWPVLAGNEENRDRTAMLASPIILYDYPQISTDSAGDFCDGTEIDEMLTLRVLTMTDGEKCEMQLDDFSRRILERTNAMGSDELSKLHGGMRKVHFYNEEFFNPTHSVKTVSVGGVELAAGDKVSIHPKRRADAIDVILAGKTAVIEALEQDAEGDVHLALVLDEDPGGDMGMARQSGHRFFYRADEVEPKAEEAP